MGPKCSRDHRIWGVGGGVGGVVEVAIGLKNFLAASEACVAIV